MKNDRNELVKEFNQQGLILFAKDKYELAKEYFEKAIEEDPYYIESYINLAQVYIMQDEYESAKTNLNKAMLIDKNCSSIYFHLGNVELLQSNTNLAKEAYTKAISLGLDKIQIYINLAADAEENGDFDTAISYYNKVIALDNYNAFSKARKVQILVALKKYPEALKASDSLIETNPDVFEGYHYKFSILTELEKFDDAETVLDRALKLFPDDLAFMYDKARILQIRGKFDEALKLVDEFLTHTEDDRSTIVTFKAELLLALDRVPEALNILLEEYPKSKDAEVAFLINSIYISKKEYESVLKYSEEIIEKSEVDNFYYSALYYHAVAMNKLGRTKEAEEEFENAARFFRAACSRQPGQIQLYFYRAMCHEELKQYDKALELTEYILNVDENIAEARLIRMKVFEAMGKVSEAEAERNIIASKNPELLEMMEA